MDLVDKLLMQLSDYEKIISTLKKENEELKEQISKLILKSKQTEKHNSRNAGRKPIFTKEEQEDILDYKNAGFTTQEVAQKFNTSPATVNRILKKLNY